MNTFIAAAPSIIDRVKRNLVELKMPRALEILDVTLRGMERGEITALEAIDTLLGSGARTPLGTRFVELMRQPAKSPAPRVPG